MNKMNFTKSILNEVAGYYSNSKNFLNEEASAVMADGDIMSRIMDMVDNEVFEQNSDGSYIIPISNDPNYETSVIISDNGEAVITDRDGNENELSLSQDQIEQILNGIKGNRMVAEQSVGNPIYRQTMGNPVKLEESMGLDPETYEDDYEEEMEYNNNQQKWNPSMNANDPVIAVIDDEDIDSEEPLTECLRMKGNRLFESIYEDEPMEADNNDLLQRAIEAYNDATNNDIDVVDITDGKIELEINAEPDPISLVISFDYDVSTYNEVSATYEEPGYLDFESEIKGTGLKVYVFETGEEQEYSDGEGLMFANSVANDYKDIVDDNFIDGTSPEDYMDRFFDPDENYDSRFDN